MNHPDCRNEQVQRARRGRLSRREVIAFEAHVATCEDCRLTHCFGRDFDRLTDVDSADAIRLERMTERADDWVERSRGLAKASRSRWLLVAMSTTLAAGAATIAAGNRPQRALDPASATSASTEVGWQRLRGGHVATPAQHAPGDRDAAVSEVSDDPSARTNDRPYSAPTAGSTQPIPVASSSAEQLLQAAHLARRGGNSHQAVQLFRRLQREFPSSREANLSLVALGGLLLEHGQAAESLVQFDRYLRLGPVAVLRAEALYGKGRALGQLQRIELEQQIWRQLLSEFPKSPYASHAKRRLAAVE